MEQRNENDIAILGLACRFPGAPDSDTFWHNLRRGVASIMRFSEEELLAAGVPRPWLDSPQFVRAGATIPDIDRFDAAFFSISPAQAELLDPQQRLFLECAWQALENAAVNPLGYPGAIGLYAGAGINTYLLHHLTQTPGFAERTDRYRIKHASDKDFLTTRVSYKLDLRGPSIDIQSSCSTSLVAVHLACQSLLNGECDLAMAGGVTLTVPQKSGYFFHEGMIRSPDGACRAFDASARGTVDGNGLGIVVLKPLAEALEDGDPIRAIIKGSAVNNDGAAKVSFTAPAMDGQAAVIAEALAVAGVPAASISYVEAHGTATAMGDPIEIAALTHAFRRSTERRGFCAVGSVKTNIGHLDTAAGVAGLIKTVLALEHRELPPSLFFEKPNPQIDFETSPFFVNARLKTWVSEGPRRAGVSSFGVGGTNAHVILEEAPPPRATHPTDTPHVLPLSAKTGTALDAATANLADYLEAHAHLDLASVAATLQNGRAAMRHRRYVVAENLAAAVEGLRAGLSSAKASTQPAGSESTPDLVFLFPGQGAQAQGMGARLYREEAHFRQWIDRGLVLLKERSHLDLHAAWFPTVDGEPETAALDRTESAQPALYLFEYALAQWWLARGLRPAAMIGHSIGEYVAAALAGVFSFEDGLALIAERARLMQQLPPGGMLAVALAEDTLAPYLEDGLSLAAVNAPDRCVLAGPVAAIARAQTRLKQAGVFCGALKVSHAFHSEMMAPALAPFLQKLRSVTLRPPQIPFISNLSGSWIGQEEATDPQYWARHLRGTVRFGDGPRLLAGKPATLLLEVGPGRTLAGLVTRCEAFRDGGRVFSSLDHAGAGLRCLLETLGGLWCAGANPNWPSLHPGGPPRRVALPGYPFERRGFWLQGTAPPRRKAPAPATCVIPVWQRSRPPAPASAPRQHWLLIHDDRHRDWFKALVNFLKARGADIATVTHKRGMDFAAWLGDLEEPPHTILYFAGRTATAGASPFRGLVRALAECQAPPAGVRPHRLVLISGELFDVTGGETIQPRLAPDAGYLAWLAASRPDLACRHIDWDADFAHPPEARLAGLLLDELACEKRATPVAWRHMRRWLPIQRPMRSAATDGEGSLNQESVYLVCDMAGGLAFRLARSLAAKTGTNWVFVEPGRALSELRSLEPARQNRAAIAPLADELHQEEAALAKRHGFKSLASFSVLNAELDQLCRAHIYQYFESRGVATTPGSVHSRDELIQKLGLQARFAKFLNLFLHHLAHAGCIEREADRLHFRADRERVGTAAVLAERIAARYPELGELLGMLSHCVQHYGAALSGEVDAITVLYPEGRSDLMEAASGSMSRQGNLAIYLDLLREAIPRLIEHSNGRVLRILEVGAGNGRLTWALAPHLQGRPVSYTFSDIGRSFVLRAERHSRRAGYDFMDCRVLDIASEPGEQGFAPADYDLILAFNVVHATPRVAPALANLRTLLAPGGTLCLLESVSAPLAANMIWGLAEGWWLFQDEELRSLSPLLTLDRWEEVLRDGGFEDVLSFPSHPQQRGQTDCGLIFAASPPAKGNPETAGARPRFFGIRADWDDNQQPAQALALIRRKFGPIAGLLVGDCLESSGPDREMGRYQGWQELLAAESLDFRVFCTAKDDPAAGPDRFALNAFCDAFAARQGQRGDGRALSLRLPGREAPDAAFDRWAGTLLELLHQRVSPRAILEPAPSGTTAEASADAGPVAAHEIPPARGGRHPRPDLATAYAAPRNSVESNIAAIWEELLGIVKVGIHDTFYDLGGDSLLAAQVNAHLRRSFGLELPPSQLFKEPTVAGQAGIVQAVRGSEAEPAAAAATHPHMIDGEI